MQLLSPEISIWDILALSAAVVIVAILIIRRIRKRR